MNTIDAHIGLPEMALAASEFIEQIVPEVLSTGQQASVTITLKLKPAKDGRSVNVEGSVVLKRPPIREDTDDGYGGILYCAEGAVSTTDPLNPRMEGLR